MNKLQIGAFVFIIMLGGIILLISTLITGNNKINKKISPVDETKPLVYTKERFFVSELDKNSKLPYINLDSDDALIVNQVLADQYKDAKNNKLYFDYEYNKTNNILSLLIKYYEISTGEYQKMNYKIYNFDLKNNLRLDTNQIKNRLNIKQSNLKTAFDNKLQFYYQEALLDNQNLTYNEYLNYIQASYEYFKNSDLYLCKFKVACIYYQPFYDQSTIEKHILDNIYEFQVNY